MTSLIAVKKSALFDWTGAQRPVVQSDPYNLARSNWAVAFHELMRPVSFGANAPSGTYFWSSPSSFALVADALPTIRHDAPSDARTCLNAIQDTFGDSASHLAKILRVSRPMIYHYREGKIAPTVDNLRRMTLIKNIACEVAAVHKISLAGALKSPQPEGKTLLALLSDKNLDVALIRRVLSRASADVAHRKKAAENIAYATTQDRQDIMRDRHARGLPIYVGDADVPGKIVQIRPDNTRVRGRMVDRVFVPDDE